MFVDLENREIEGNMLDLEAARRSSHHSIRGKCVRFQPHTPPSPTDDCKQRSSPPQSQS